MQIVKVDAENPQPEAVDKAARVLQTGGLVVYPTETLYGIGANILDSGAIRRVFEAKGRRPDRPVSIMFRDVAHAEKFARFNDTARRLAELMLPGPLTMILPAKVPLGEMFGGEKIAVRVSPNRIVKSVLEKTRFPITATSANISGKADPICAKDALEQIGEAVDLVLDAGRCEHGKPSTVVDLSGNEIVVVREGAIPKERIVSFGR